MVGLRNERPQPLHLNDWVAYFFVFPIMSLIRWVLIIDSTTSFVETASIFSATSICFDIFSLRLVRVGYALLGCLIVIDSVAFVKPYPQNCPSLLSLLPILSIRFETLEGLGDCSAELVELQRVPPGDVEVVRLVVDLSWKQYRLDQQRRVHQAAYLVGDVLH